MERARDLLSRPLPNLLRGNYATEHPSDHARPVPATFWRPWQNFYAEIRSAYDTLDLDQQLNLAHPSEPELYIVANELGMTGRLNANLFTPVARALNTTHLRGIHVCECRYKCYGLVLASPFLDEAFDLRRWLRGRSHFKAHFIPHAYTIEMHQPLSTLAYSPVEADARCAPLAPSDRPWCPNRTESELHTVKCLSAIHAPDQLLSVPTDLHTYSPFLICRIANATSPEKICLTIGTLKHLGESITISTSNTCIAFLCSS